MRIIWKKRAAEIVPVICKQIREKLLSSAEGAKVGKLSGKRTGSSAKTLESQRHRRGYTFRYKDRAHVYFVCSVFAFWGENRVNWRTKYVSLPVNTRRQQKSNEKEEEHWQKKF